MVDDVKAAGFEVLILTVDVPGLTRRHREFKVGLSVPPKINFRTALSIAAKPSWAMSTALEGMPKFCNMQPYVSAGLNTAAQAQAMTDLVVGPTSQDAIKQIRDRWPGKLLIKGIMSSEDAATAVRLGADGIWISNHGGRQLDAMPSPVEVLSELRSIVGPDFPILADSGVRSGLDIAKMLTVGADFVFLGRAFMYGVCALGSTGPGHAIHILEEELRGVMTQVGCPTILDIKKKNNLPFER